MREIEVQQVDHKTNHKVLVLVSLVEIYLSTISRRDILMRSTRDNSKKKRNENDRLNWSKEQDKQGIKLGLTRDRWDKTKAEDLHLLAMTNGDQECQICGTRAMIKP